MLSALVVPRGCLRDNAWICGEYLTSRKHDILHALTLHVELSATALALSLVVAIPLTLIGMRRAWLRSAVLGVAGVVYTIPSLALFVLITPYFDFYSNTPIVIALVGYAQLLLLRNIFTGLAEVPADVVDAAQGMGYGQWRLLTRVQLPLALPAILAGLRVTSVSTVALLSIGGLLGRGGLGQLLYDGYQQELNAQVLTALVLIVALALAYDAVLLLVQRLTTPWTRAAR
ncbi:MAG TPA: ABC transporter permease [Mycobacteriales bacterium]|nr:ABC transporter permease [Mycobacteriales bacterium]